MSDTPSIEDDVRDVLRELVVTTGAVSARIVGDPSEEGTGVPARSIASAAERPPNVEPVRRSIALGGGEFLRVELPTRTDKAVDIEAAFDHAVRSLRNIRRRHEATQLPQLLVGPSSPPPTDRVVERIGTYLQALAGLDRATNAFLVLRGKLVASAKPPDEAEKSRWQFLARRVLGAHAPNSSHGEVVDPDAYAMSFWYDAGLLVLLAEPYAEDFVRHRCRQVARELANLLPMLEPDPSAPAMLRNRPPTGPH